MPFVPHPWQTVKSVGVVALICDMLLMPRATASAEMWPLLRADSHREIEGM